MRFSTTPTSFTEPTQGRLNKIETVYRGQTTGNTATELFIDGISGKRLVPDKNSGGLLRVTAVAYSVTTPDTSFVQSVTLFSCTPAGVLTTLDQDSGTAGTQDNIATALQGITTRARQLGTVVSADNGIYIDAVAASGSTPAYLRLQVRGTPSNVIAWEVQVEVLEVTATNS